MSAATLLTIPNILTLLRILLIPVLVALTYTPFVWRFWAAAAVFLVAAITDWFDGYLARTLNQTSAFGRFLDPVADKLMVAAALVILVQWHSNNALMVISAVIIISREITISALREWMAQIGASKSVAVNFLGKLKTTFQMIAIPLLLFNDSLLGIVDASVLGAWLIYVAAVLTLWSMFYYMKLAWPQIRERSGLSGEATAQK